MPAVARLGFVLALGALLAGVGGCRSTETSLTGPSGSKCTISLSFAGGVLPAAGGTAAVGVTTGRECTWSASSTAPWIAVGTANGQGSGSVPLTFTANTATSQRQGSVTVGGQTLVLTQAATPCQYRLDPSAISVSAAATSAQVTMSVQAGCTWTAVSNVAWLSVSGGSGSGSGQFTVAVQSNDEAQRVGTVTVASQTFTVTQASGPLGCSYTLSPSAQSFGAGGGTGSFGIATTAGCQWTALPGASWLTISGSASGSGPGSVTFSVAANTGAARTASIGVSGQSFTVSQDSGSPSCTYAIDPTSRTFDQAGGTSTVAVTAPGGCQWSASSSAPWIRITSGGEGNGNGTVAFAVDVNPGGPRTAIMTVAGQTLQVSQSGCTFSIAPTSASAGPGGGPGSVAVSAQAGCTWTAASNDSWLTVTSGASGSGPGTVSYSVAANTGAARGGSITIAGQTFTVSQAEAVVTCNYSVSPTSDTLPATAGNRIVQVSTQGGCAWTAAANASWVRITGSVGGTGSGSVTYEFDANPSSAQRTATLTVAGQTVSLTQAGAACSYSVSPTTFPFAASGGSGSITVTAPSGCGWTAASTVPWISISSGATGSGNGTVNFSVAANVTGSTRPGEIRVQDQVVTITQSP